MTRTGWIASACFCFFAGLLILCAKPHITQGMYGEATDEEQNLTYAAKITTQGVAVFPSLFDDFLQQIQLRRFYPTPLRVAAILLSGFAVAIGGAVFGSLQNLSLAAFLSLIFMVCTGLSRHVKEETGLWTGLLVCVSPLQLAMASRALSDSLVAAVLFGCLWLCLEGLERKKPAGWWAAVALGYSLAFLVKELAVILVPISVFLILWLGSGFPAANRRQMLLSVSLIPLAATGLVLVLAAGSAQKAWEAVFLTATSFSSNTYIARFGRGPWYAYLVDYLLLSPWTLLACLGWVGWLVAGEGLRKKQGRLLAAWSVAIPGLFLLFAAFFAKNVRYALILDVPIRLGAVCFLSAVLQRYFPKYHKTLFILALALVAFADLQTFYQFFHQGGVYDPVTAELLARRRFF